MSKRFQTGMVLLLMSLFTAMLTLIAGSSLRLASLQSRSTDGFRNHVQALHAAEIALAHCEEIIDERMSGSAHLPVPAPEPAGDEVGATGLTPIDDVIDSSTWRDSRRWEKYAASLIDVPLARGSSMMPAQCVIDELRAPRRFIATARGFSPNYSRADHDFGGAEVWVQSVTVPEMRPASVGSAPSPGALGASSQHSWRQLVSPPH